MVIECAENVEMRQYEQQVAQSKSNLSTQLSEIPLRVVASALQTPRSSTTPGSVSAHTMHSVSQVYEADAVPIPLPLLLLPKPYTLLTLNSKPCHFPDHSSVCCCVRMCAIECGVALARTL